MSVRTTRAAVCHAFGEPHTIEELQLRAPLTDEVLVRVGACAVCHSDISYASGAWGGELPAVYGHEAAGTVLEVGSSVDRVAVGERVVVTLVRACGTCPSCTRGRPALCVDEPSVDSPLSFPDGRPVVQGLRTAAFADHVLVHRSQVVRIPDDVSLEVASLLGCGVLTGIGAAMHTATIATGDTVVVIGAGGIGLNCVQGAKLAGAAAIVAIDPVETKRAAALAFGATHAVAPEGAAATIDELTGGFGADTVLVATGAKPALESGMAMLSRGGTLVVVGMPAGEVTLELSPADLAHHGRRVIGSKMGSTRPDIDIPWLLGLYAEGALNLDALISGRYPLDELDHAIAAVVRGEALRNVILLDPSS